MVGPAIAQKGLSVTALAVLFFWEFLGLSHIFPSIFYTAHVD